MSIADQFDSSFSEGLRLKLYKSVIPGREKPPQWDFFLWGASNFLYIDRFSSLAEFVLPEDDQSPHGLGGNNNKVAENRFLYLYKDSEVNLFPDKKIKWIFQPDVDYPLIVITLLHADLGLIIPKFKNLIKAISLKFDFFKTLGQGTGVLVIRCKTYSQVISCLIELNGLSENTYSIAGAENPFTNQGKQGKRNSFLFSNLLQTDGVAATSGFQAVVLNYMLKESNKSGNRMRDVVNKVAQLREKIINDFHLSEQALNISSYYEIGRFDIEVRIEGHIVYILELLLNPDYGLANIESKFYKEYIFESRTTWKTPSL